MVPSPTLVSWITPAQFRKVYNFAYDVDISKKRWAVEQMSVWESRCWPTLPFAVEATSLVVRAEIQNMLYEADKTLCQAKEIEMMYNTAVIRFVNLLAETQQNSYRKKRIEEIAEQLNLPHWIIDVRHNAVHGCSPTLPVLIMACKGIMDYLENNFWKPELNRLSALVKKLAEEYYLKLIERYRKLAQEEVINEYAFRSKAKGKIKRKVLNELYAILGKPTKRLIFLKILTHPDNFVTMEDIDITIGEDMAFKQDFDDLNHPVLPIAFEKLWKQMIVAVHKNDCLTDFLELLLLNQEKRKYKIFQKVVDYLVLHVISASLSKNENGLFYCFSRKGAMIDMHRLLFACMRGSSAYSQYTFQNISEFLVLGDWKNEFSAMLGIKQGMAVDKETANEKNAASRGQKRAFDITFTVEDLEEDIHNAMVKRNPTLHSTRWCLGPPRIDFCKLPVGVVFSPVLKKEVKEEPIKKIEVIKKVETVEESYTEPDGSRTIEVPAFGNFIFSKIHPRQSLIYQRKVKYVRTTKYY